MGNFPRLPGIMQASCQPGRKVQPCSTSWNSRRPPSADGTGRLMTAESACHRSVTGWAGQAYLPSRWVGAPGARIGIDNQILCPLRGSRHTHRLRELSGLEISRPSAARSVPNTIAYRHTQSHAVRCNHWVRARGRAAKPARRPRIPGAGSRKCRLSVRAAASAGSAVTESAVLLHGQTKPRERAGLSVQPRLASLKWLMRGNTRPWQTPDQWPGPFRGIVKLAAGWVA